ncbi:hypothetical protein ScPMuIL_017528 [Solemya velum]
MEQNNILNIMYGLDFEDKSLYYRHVSNGIMLAWLLDYRQGLGSEDEGELVRNLFEESGYNPLIRPVRSGAEPITIQFNLALSQLIFVDEKNQVMKTNVWLQMYWHDYQLQWNPDEYGQIDTIRIRPERAWRPDIVLFNNADGNYEVSYEPNLVISYNGEVVWIPPAIFISSCEIDVEYFPFDQQECEMKFGSWTFSADQLNFTFYQGMDSLDFTDYLKSGTWDIIDCPGRIQQGHGEEKTMVIFKFVLRRKTLFYTVNLIIPCVLISFVSICVFGLPADAGEKITLCISILLALVVFLLLVSKTLPPSLKIPLIAKYLLFTFIMNILAILLTVIVINRNYRTPRTHQMPYWVRYMLLNLLPKILFMERPDHDERWRKSEEEIPKPSTARSPEIRYACRNAQKDLMELSEVHHPNCRLKHRSTTIYSSEETECPITMTPELCRGTDALRFIANHLEQEDEYETVLNDWRYAARVVDRLLLLIFICVTVGGTIGILMEAPHILEFVDQDEIINNMMSKIPGTKDGKV